jgi:hypothetical protein
VSLNSPWTCLGRAPFERNAAIVNIKPCKFGPILEQTGGLPLPKRSPQRRAYRMMEIRLEKLTRQKKQGATGITTVAPYVAGQWGRGNNRLP